MAKQLGPAVRAHREAAGVTQRALADAVGVSAPAITALEKGRSGVSAATVESIIAALGLKGGEADAIRAARLADGGKLPALAELERRLDAVTSELEAVNVRLAALAQQLAETARRQ